MISSTPAGKRWWGAQFACRNWDFALSEDTIINSGAIGQEGGLGTIPKGRSIAHNIFNNQNAVFLSFDIETAGEIAGVYG